MTRDRTTRRFSNDDPRGMKRDQGSSNDHRSWMNDLSARRWPVDAHVPNRLWPCATTADERRRAHTGTLPLVGDFGGGPTGSTRLNFRKHLGEPCERGGPSALGGPVQRTARTGPDGQAIAGLRPDHRLKALRRSATSSLPPGSGSAVPACAHSSPQRSSSPSFARLSRTSDSRSSIC